MYNAFKSYEPLPGERYYYCAVCWFWLNVKDMAPGDHEPGVVSNGSWTMRRRSRRGQA